jgi:hypothetical protein
MKPGGFFSDLSVNAVFLTVKGLFREQPGCFSTRNLKERGGDLIR